jgi:hypothetical protein
MSEYSFNIADEVRKATVKFLDSIFSGNTNTAFEKLISHARSIGLRSPSLKNVYTLNDTDAMSYARTMYLDEVLCGDMKVGKFVDDVFMHVAIQAAYSNPHFLTSEG